MKKKLLMFLVTFLFLFGITGFANAVVIDFAGGTATLWPDDSIVTTTNTGLWNSIVKSYVEDGMKVEFIGGLGTIGDYYSIGSGTGGGPPYENSVIHAHPFNEVTIKFSKIDGSAFDLNYVDMTSNTITGGSQSTGTEESYITASNGSSMLLPSSDWGLDYDFYGFEGDGIARLWLTSAFDNITYFQLTSQNAYCFGMDNFYIDEPPPPQVPEPSSLLLLGAGLVFFAGAARKRFKK